MQQFDFTVRDVFPEIFWNDGMLNIKVNEEYSRQPEYRKLKVGLTVSTSYPLAYPVIALNRTGAQYLYFRDHLPETLGEFQDMIDEGHSEGENTLQLSTPIDFGATDHELWNTRVFISDPNDTHYFDNQYERISDDY